MENNHNLEYLTSEETKEQKERVAAKQNKVNEFLKTGILDQVIAKYLKKEMRILELGCSRGVTLKKLKEAGYEDLWASDLDDYLVYPEFKNNFFVADLNKDTLPLEKESVDAVIVLNVAEHLENPFHFAREMSKILRQGGYLILSMPNGHTILDKINFFFRGNVFAYRPKNNHIAFFLNDIFGKIFRDFTIEEVKYGFPWVPYLRPRWLNKKLPRCKLLSYNKLYILKKIQTKCAE